MALQPALDRAGLPQVDFTPLDTVPDFMRCLSELKESCKGDGLEQVSQKCDELAKISEQLTWVMMRQYRTHPLHMQEVSDAFRLSLHRIMQLKGLVLDMDNYIRQQEQMVSGGEEIEPNQSAPLMLDGVPVNYQKQRNWDESSFHSMASQESRAVSFEDIRKSLISNLASHPLPGKGAGDSFTGRSTAESSESGTDDFGGRRKAKSEADAHIKNLSQRIDSLKSDVSRLRDSERNLLKQTTMLNRKCKTLEQERDRAENRLKVEQTQRDSIQKLREKNAKLESQLQELCKLQVWREEEKERLQQELGKDEKENVAEQEQPQTDEGHEDRSELKEETKEPTEE